MPFHFAPALPLLVFAGEYADAVISVAELLGGDPGRPRCARLLEDLREGRSLIRRLAEETRWLIGLLGLEDVGDPDWVEAASHWKIPSSRSSAACKKRWWRSSPRPSPMRAR